MAAPLADVDDVRLSTRWAFLTLIPATLASGDGPPPWQPPPIHSAADLPAAMAAALGDVCRFEPMFTGGLGGCKCKPDPDPTHLIPRPQCDPPPEPGSPAFDRLQLIARALASDRLPPTAELVRARALWRLVWSDSPENVNQAVEELQQVQSETDDSISAGDLASAFQLQGSILQDGIALLRALDERQKPELGVQDQSTRRALWRSGGARRDESQRGLDVMAARLVLQRLLPFLQFELGGGVSQQAAWNDFAGTVSRLGFSDTELIPELVAQDSERLRILGEDELLTQWALCELRGAQRQGQVALESALALGRHLRRTRGEGLLEAAAQSILTSGRAARADAALGLVDLRFAGALSRCGRAGAAARVYGSASARLRKLRNPMSLWADLGAAYCLYRTDRVAEADALVESVAKQPIASSFISLSARLNWILGTLSFSGGRALDAEEFYSRASSGYTTIGELGNQAIVEAIAGESAAVAGRLEHGAARVMKALHSIDRVRDGRRRGQILMAAAYIARAQGLLRAAALFLSAADFEARLGGQALEQAYAKLDLAEVLARLGNLSQATQVAKAAGETARGISPLESAMILQAQSEIVVAESSSASDPAVSLRASAHASRLLESSSDSDLSHRALLARANALQHQGKVAEAVDVLRQDFVTLMDKWVVRGEDRGRVLPSLDADYSALISLLACDLDSPEESLDWLLHRMDFHFTRQPRDVRRVGSGAELKRLKALLPPRGIALVLEPTPREILRWQVTREEIRFDRIQVAEEKRANMLRDLRESAQGRLRNAAAFSRILLRSIVPVERLSSQSTVVWLLSGDLSGLPTSGLPDLRTGAWSMAPWKVLRLETLRPWADVAPSEARPRVAPAVVFFGDPAFDRDAYPSLAQLPGATLELAELRKATSSLTELVGAGATASAFRTAAESADLIIVSTHTLRMIGADAGQALLVAPERSRDDSVFATDEIESLHLARHPSVLLLGCSTGTEIENEIGETISIARSFLRAGARDVIASFWNIDDSATAMLAADVVRNVLHGERVEVALRSSQIRAASMTSGMGGGSGNWAGLGAVR